jgi:hypothetical protein
VRNLDLESPDFETDAKNAPPLSFPSRMESFARQRAAVWFVGKPDDGQGLSLSFFFFFSGLVHLVPRGDLTRADRFRRCSGICRHLNLDGVRSRFSTHTALSV